MPTFFSFLNSKCLHFRERETVLRLNANESQIKVELIAATQRLKCDRIYINLPDESSLIKIGIQSHFPLRGNMQINSNLKTHHKAKKST